MRRFILLLFTACAACCHAAHAGGGPIGLGPIAFDPDTPVTAGGSVSMSVEASGGNGELEYRWNFGDGGPSTGWVPGLSEIDHAYSEPGTFLVQVQARDGTGQFAARTRRIVAQPPAGALPPARSDSIVVDEAARRVWVVNPDHGSVAALHADDLEREFVTETCPDPRSVALDAFGRPWVACRGNDRLLRLNPGDGSIDISLDADYGAAPETMVFTPDGLTGFASLGGAATVIRFDPDTGNVTGNVDAGPNPHALAVTAAGDRLLVSRLVSDSDEHGSIVEIALPTMDFAGEIALPLDTISPDSGTAGRGLPNYVATLALSPDDSRLWYTAKKDNIVRGQWREGTDLTFESTVRVMTGAIDLDGGEELLPARMDLDDSSLALALAPSPGGAHLFVALAGNHRILALDPWQKQEVDRLDVGFTPRGLAVDSVSGHLFVRNDLDRTVTVIDAAELMAAGLPVLEEIATIATVDDEALPSEVLSGKRVFWNAEDTRMAQDGYLSCASCHLDGGGDGRVWDFTQQGEGLRATIPLNGRGDTAHGLLHWSANFDEVQDFEVQIRSLFAGAGFIDDDDFQSDTLGPPMAGLSQELDHLAAYLSSLGGFGRSAHRAPGGSLTADGEAGRQIFEDLGCHRCHGGPEYTDSGLGVMHDTGTLAEHGGGRLGGPLPGLDTPTLRGLWKRAPFLHDGSAPTVQAVLEGLDTRHGNPGELSEVQMAQLAAFLLQIDDSEPAAPEVAGGATWLTPAHGETLDARYPVALAVETDYPDIERVEFVAGDETVATLTAPPWNFEWNGGSGTVWLYARIVHGGGLHTVTVPVRVMVQPPGNVVFDDRFEAD